MNIFGVGGAELVVIILIMLIVAGPRRMLHWAYILGKWTAKLRDMWREVMVVVQKEIDEAGIDVKLPDEMPTRQNLARWSQEAIKPYADKMRDAEAEVRGELADVEREVRTFTSEANAVAADFSQMNKDMKREGEAPASDNARPANGNGTQRPFGAWTDADQPAADVTPPPTETPAAHENRSSGFGTWGAEASGDELDESAANGAFGTWSNN